MAQVEIYKLERFSTTLGSWDKCGAGDRAELSALMQNMSGELRVGNDLVIKDSVYPRGLPDTWVITGLLVSKPSYSKETVILFQAKPK